MICYVKSVSHWFVYGQSNMHRWGYIGEIQFQQEGNIIWLFDIELFLHVFTCMERYASYASSVLLKHILCITFFFIDR